MTIWLGSGRKYMALDQITPWGHYDTKILTYDVLITPTNILFSNTGSAVYGALNLQCSMLPHTQGIMRYVEFWNYTASQGSLYFSWLMK